MDHVEFRQVPYEHSDAKALIEEVQLEYVARYGSRDASPVDVTEFSGDAGSFWVGYLDQVPVVTGGWRLLADASLSPFPSAVVAEVKRMYVTPAARGRGVARALLRHLERTARAAGVDWLVLETGMVQPEALALYRSSGYADVPAFGHYACAPLSVHLGRRLV